MNRAVRVMHAALAGGLIVAGAVLGLVRSVAPPALPDPSLVGLVLTVVAGTSLVVAATVLRPRVPARATGQDAATYWDDPTTRGAAIVLWAAAEGPGLLAAVGYYLTGGTAPALAFAAAVFVLLAYRPQRLEGKGRDGYGMYPMTCTPAPFAMSTTSMTSR